MNKTAILGMACATFMSATSFAQSTQEVTYVQDTEQGVLLNRFKDNWFITAEGGANVMMSKFDQHRKFTDRFSPAASFYVGKWFSPVLGVRLGVNFLSIKSLSEIPEYSTPGDYMPQGYYKQRYNLVGPAGDVMLNLTNWWCGYKPDRVYNAMVYLGGAAYFAYAKDYTNGEYNGWKKQHDFTTSLRAGIINSFNVSKQVAISLDLRGVTLDTPPEHAHKDPHKTCWNLEAYIGITYLFNQRTWSAPVVPICPEPEDCSAVEARLQAATARISDLESQLTDCLNRPVQQQQCEETTPALTTIYYPIGVSKLSNREMTVLRSVADVMKNTPDQKYKITGWADNYTGTERVNERLRHARANGVAAQLKRFGVPESQLEVGIDNSNLTTYGAKAVSLDRAVTIDVAK